MFKNFGLLRSSKEKRNYLNTTNTPSHPLIKILVNDNNNNNEEENIDDKIIIVHNEYSLIELNRIINHNIYNYGNRITSINNAIKLNNFLNNIIDNTNKDSNYYYKEIFKIINEKNIHNIDTSYKNFFLSNDKNLFNIKMITDELYYNIYIHINQKKKIIKTIYKSSLIQFKIESNDFKNCIKYKITINSSIDGKNSMTTFYVIIIIENDNLYKKINKYYQDINKYEGIIYMLTNLFINYTITQNRENIINERDYIKNELENLLIKEQDEPKRAEEEARKRTEEEARKRTEEEARKREEEDYIKSIIEQNKKNSRDLENINNTNLQIIINKINTNEINKENKEIKEIKEINDNHEIKYYNYIIIIMNNNITIINNNITKNTINTLNFGNYYYIKTYQYNQIYYLVIYDKDYHIQFKNIKNNDNIILKYIIFVSANNIIYGGKSSNKKNNEKLYQLYINPNDNSYFINYERKKIKLNKNNTFKNNNKLYLKINKNKFVLIYK